ncbi:hypothetical protein [Cohnella fermenti]|uniref:Uncharacterized protein n=1 Tax=Cohnella fermenti TaxID=2565925 RepID=A0A4S4BEU9_9BACL|nr:hypothetical protein [Cohnella fermenti]THF72719.1 hypothetical protein E6C55_32260 [Cohnella fermenti]
MRMLMSLIIVVLLAACQGNGSRPDAASLMPITLEKAYAGNIGDVDRLELLDGSTGERKLVNDREAVQEWIGRIKGIELVPEADQQGRVGYLFSVGLYEGDEKTFGFLPSEINGIYYEENNELTEQLRALFEEQFGRSF